jgi:hypothetical protein
MFIIYRMLLIIYMHESMFKQENIYRLFRHAIVNFSTVASKCWHHFKYITIGKLLV